MSLIGHTYETSNQPCSKILVPLQHTYFPLGNSFPLGELESYFLIRIPSVVIAHTQTKLKIMHLFHGHTVCTVILE